MFKAFIWIINAGILLSYGMASDARLTGSIRAESADSLCTTGEVQIRLRLGTVVLYEERIPVGGSFEFHARPGQYDLIATTSNGCTAEQHLSLSRSGAQSTSLTLKGNRDSRPSS